MSPDQISRAMFAADYFAARSAFTSATGVSHEALALDVRGPQGEELAIDIAWRGDPDARRLLLVVSGVHGVEGFAGSAVQNAFLSAAHAVPAGCAVVLVHALNPWGFAHLRRVNEHNVDLNRNFLRRAESYHGAPPLYRALDRFLNPRSPPGPDGFLLRAGLHLLRHGTGALRQTIAGGQYDFEHGLFFGGKQLEQGAALILRWLNARCRSIERLLAIDLHTGLGAFGQLGLFAGAEMGRERVRRFAERLQIAIAEDTQADGSGGYAASGSLRDALPELLPHAQVDALVAEFGTFSGLRLLHALREENRLHHYADARLDHPAKRRLLAAFRPDSASWRVAVTRRGTELLQRALELLARDA
jgi:hypothetical protein